MVDLFLRCSALRSQESNSGLRRRWTAMVGLFLRCPDLRRQPHRWQEGGSLYRNATSDGCNHLAGPSHRQPPLSRTRYLRSGFNRTRWRCRCSPCRRGSGSSHRSIRPFLQRRDCSSRRRRQWHLLQQHLRLQRGSAPVFSPLCRRRVWWKRPRRQRARHRRRYCFPHCVSGGGD